MELTFLILGIVSLVKGINYLKTEKKGEIEKVSLIKSHFLIINGVVLIVLVLGNFKVLLDPCERNMESYECLDQQLQIAVIKNKEHRSEGK